LVGKRGQQDEIGKQQPLLSGIKFLEHLQATGNDGISTTLRFVESLHKQETDCEVVVGEFVLAHALELPLEERLDLLSTVDKPHHHFEIDAE